MARGYLSNLLACYWRTFDAGEPMNITKVKFFLEQLEPWYIGGHVTDPQAAIDALRGIHAEVYDSQTPDESTYYKNLLFGGEHEENSN